MASPLRPDDDTDTDEQQPAPQQAPAKAPRSNEEHGALMGRWMDHLGDPDNRAALISFGASMLQPSWYGFGSTFGQALGTAAETVTGRQQMAEKRREAEEKEAIARGGLAIREREAGAYGKAARAAEAREEANRMQSIIQSQRLYQNYANEVDKQNKEIEANNALLPKNSPQIRSLIPKQPQREWIQENLPGLIREEGAPRAAPGVPGSRPLPSIHLPKGALSARDAERLRSNPRALQDEAARKAFEDKYGEGSADVVERQFRIR